MVHKISALTHVNLTLRLNANIKVQTRLGNLISINVTCFLMLLLFCFIVVFCGFFFFGGGGGRLP